MFLCQGCDRTFYPGLCPVSAITAIVMAPRSNSLLDIKLTPAASVPSVPPGCYLRSSLCWRLRPRTETPMAPRWRPGPPHAAPVPARASTLPRLPAMAGRPVAMMAALPSPRPTQPWRGCHNTSGNGCFSAIKINLSQS